MGGTWNILKTERGWQPTNSKKKNAESTVIIKPELAWKLFSKGISPGEAAADVIFSGNKILGEVALQMISVMA